MNVGWICGFIVGILGIIGHYDQSHGDVQQLYDFDPQI